MKGIFFATAGLAMCFSLAPAIGNAGTLPTLAFQNSREQTTETMKTFTGTVAKQGDLYILTDKADKTNYQLDDPKKVSEYEGKKVKVTGTLDAENLTIHVNTIEEVA